MAGGMAFITARFTQPSPEVVHPALVDRSFIAFDSIGFYLRKLVLTFDYVPDYGRTPQWSLANAARGPAIAVVAGITVLSVALVRRHPWVLTAWLAFVLGMVPTLGLVPFGYQAYSTVADRYAYLSMLAPAIAAAFGTRWFVRTIGARRACAVTCIPIVVLSVLAFVQTSLWRDGNVLFRHNLAVNPNSAAAEASIGVMLDMEGHPEQAYPLLLRAAEARPFDVRSWQYVGRVRAEAGDFDGAARYLRKAIDLAHHGGFGVTVPDQAYALLGAALDQGGHPAEAENALLEAIRLNPENIDAQRNLRVFYLKHRLRARSSD